VLSEVEELELEEELADISADQVLASICEESFYEFFLEMWDTIEAVTLVPNWHLRFICDQLQQMYEAWERGESQDDALLNVPPGSSKSTIVTQLFPAWLWLKQPSFRIISSSYAADLSVGHALKSRDCVRSDKFRSLWPGRITFKADQDGKTNYRNTAMGQRFSTSTNGRVTGMHGDCIIIDDPIDPEHASSEVARAAAAGHLRKLVTRTTDKARTFRIMVMQRVHELDPAGIWLASGQQLRHICLPGEISEHVRPAELRQYYVDGLLDPRRLNRAALVKLKVALGSYGYAGQIGQVPTPAEGGILKKAWFRTTTWLQFLDTVPGARHAPWLFDADTAYTDKQKNDPTALLASAYLGQTLYVRWAGEMWLELPALKLKLLELVKTHGYASPMSKLHIEPKASGKSVVQELRAISQLNVVEAPTPHGEKTERVNGASPFIESGRVVLILDAPGAPLGWHEPFVGQASGFPTAAHDDMLDTLTQAIARYNNQSDDWGVSS
jgi:predicted phage terminase large subunit-like protein